MSYMTLSSQEKHFLLFCSYFRAHPTTLLLKILGGRMHGLSPHLKFWGIVPPVSPRSPPLTPLAQTKINIKPKPSTENQPVSFFTHPSCVIHSDIDEPGAMVHP